MADEGGAPPGEGQIQLFVKVCGQASLLCLFGCV
jgi:hypothetical protein